MEFNFFSSSIEDISFIRLSPLIIKFVSDLK